MTRTSLRILHSKAEIYDLRERIPRNVLAATEERQKSNLR